MRKHPDAFRVSGQLADLNTLATVTNSAVTLYDGPVRELCPLAPNNVNTMAAAALAAHNLGFDLVTGKLVAELASGDNPDHNIEALSPRRFT